MDARWFKELTFPDQIAIEENLDTSSLFAVKGSSVERPEHKLEFGKCLLPDVDNYLPSKSVVRTEHKLEFGKYLFPNAANHPYIDRACLAVHRPDNTLCLVLYQDKINANGMLAAAEGLNEAATALHDEMKIPVLCVAQVIGAPLHKRFQSDFKHPYILIRDDEVPQFYTPIFAPALRFVRQRHALSALMK